MKIGKGKCQDGFSLIEMIVVIAVIAILAAIGIPAFINWVPNINLQSAARNLVSHMEEAKVAAIKTNTNVTFAFNPAVTCPGGSYTFTDGNGDSVVNIVLNDNLCLTVQAGNFNAANEGYDPRSLPLGNGGEVELTHVQSASLFKIRQNASGGITLDRE